MDARLLRACAVPGAGALAPPCSALDLDFNFHVSVSLPTGENASILHLNTKLPSRIQAILSGLSVCYGLEVETGALGHP